MMINSKTKTKGQTSAIELVLIIPVIVAAIIVFILLVPNYSYTAGSEVNTYQLNAMAQSLLEYIITNPGNPPNWGLNASHLSSFGLAMPNQPYHLDPFKVMALEYWDFANGYLPNNLVNKCSTSQIAKEAKDQVGKGFADYLNQHGINNLTISGYWLLLPVINKSQLLNYTEVKQLLGLNRSKYDIYDFMLVIQPVLNITAKLNGTTLYVNVTSNGEPVSNASVSIQGLIADENGDDLENAYTNSLSTKCTVIMQNPLILKCNATTTTDSNGIAAIPLPVSFDSDNTYFILITASIGGIQDYAYYQYPSQTTPLLLVGIIPNGANYNSIIFVDPHVVEDCLYNSGLLANPGQSALGLRIVAVYRSLYGYTFESLNFTLNPGKGAGSYPVSCTSLAQSQSNQYSTCYWNLPDTPTLLIIDVVRNSQGQQVPLAQLIVVPYGLYPNYLLGDKPIIFGKSVKNAPVGVARALVYIGDSAYYITLYLYYGGNVFGPMG